MKILMVCPYIPSPTSGNRSRSYYLLKMLARQHSVSLLALDEGATIPTPLDMVSLESFTQRVEVLHPSKSYSKRARQLVNVMTGKSNILYEQGTRESQSALDKLFDRDHYDAVIFESALTGGYRLPEHVKIIANQHNVEFEFLQRIYQHQKDWLRKWYYYREYRLIKPVEIRLCQEADAIAVTSERERLLLKKMLPYKIIEAVPNGVDIEYFHRESAEQEVEGRIVFTGAMDYYPNVEAVLFFAKECWPLIRERIPDASWQIVGKNPLLEVQKLAELPGVTVTGSVADVRPYFASAMVAIVPLKVGGGTRLKILEAMAMRKAVVSTSLGCEGLSVVPEQHLLVADEPETLAQAVIRLLRNAEERHSLAAAGRVLVEGQYSWDQCGDRLQHILDQLNY